MAGVCFCLGLNQVGEARAATPQSREMKVLEEPAAIPSLSFVDETGAERTLESYRGHPVVLNIWASWCLPCLTEMPSLDALQADLEGQGLRVLPLTVDRAGTTTARYVFDKHAIRHLPVLAARGIEVVRALHEEVLPLTLLIDSQGREVARMVGPAEWDHGSFRDAVERLVAGRPLRPGTNPSRDTAGTAR